MTRPEFLSTFGPMAITSTVVMAVAGLAAPPLSVSDARHEVVTRMTNLDLAHPWAIKRCIHKGPSAVACDIRERNALVCPDPCKTLSSTGFVLRRRLDWRVKVYRARDGRIRIFHPWLPRVTTP